ncbi:MAG: hypothetical protein R6W94_10315, partial [Spirochaetia bacterium]
FSAGVGDDLLSLPLRLHDFVDDLEHFDPFIDYIRRALSLSRDGGGRRRVPGPPVAAGAPTSTGAGSRRGGAGDSFGRWELRAWE